ncbi:MAG: hypothetical protein MR319_00490 [Mediterranea sp.]|nr:hypothetical protein [Mediterranea sp.]
MNNGNTIFRYAHGRKTKLSSAPMTLMAAFGMKSLLSRYLATFVFLMIWMRMPLPR